MGLLEDLRAALGMPTATSLEMERKLSRSGRLRLDMVHEQLVYTESESKEWIIRDVRRSSRKPRSPVPIGDTRAQAREFVYMGATTRVYFFRQEEDHAIGEDIIDRQFKASKLVGRHLGDLLTG